VLLNYSYNKNKGGLPVISIEYLCPDCATVIAISNIEKIKNSQDEYPLKCPACGGHISKDALIKFARQKAQAMIDEALSQLKKTVL